MIDSIALAVGLVVLYVIAVSIGYALLHVLWKGSVTLYKIHSMRHEIERWMDRNRRHDGTWSDSTIQRLGTQVHEQKETNSAFHARLNALENKPNMTRYEPIYPIKDSDKFQWDAMNPMAVSYHNAEDEILQAKERIEKAYSTKAKHKKSKRRKTKR